MRNIKRIRKQGKRQILVQRPSLVGSYASYIFASAYDASIRNILQAHFFLIFVKIPGI